MFIIRQSPCVFVDGFVQEDGSSNNTVVGDTEISQPLSIVIHHSTSMCAHYYFVVDVISPSFGVKVTIYEQQIMLRGLGNSRLWLLVPVIFHFRGGFIIWCIALQNGKVAVLWKTHALTSQELIGPHSFKVFDSLFGYYQGNTMGTGGIVSRVDGNGFIVMNNTSRASPSVLANPQDVEMVPFHLLEDLSCFWWLPHDSSAPGFSIGVGDIFSVSVTKIFLQGGVVGPTPNLRRKFLGNFLATIHLPVHQGWTYQ